MTLLCCVSLNSPLVHWYGTRQDCTRYSNTVEGITSFFTLLKLEESCACAFPPWFASEYVRTQVCTPTLVTCPRSHRYPSLFGFLAVSSSVGGREHMRVSMWELSNVRTWSLQSVWRKESEFCVKWFLIRTCGVRGTYVLGTLRLWEMPVQLSEIGYILQWDVTLNECAVYSVTAGGGGVYELEVTVVGCSYELGFLTFSLRAHKRAAAPVMHKCRGAGSLFQYHTGHITCLTVHSCTQPCPGKVRQISRQKCSIRILIKSQRVSLSHVVSECPNPEISYGVVIWNEHAATRTLHPSTWGWKRIQLPKRRVISWMIDDGHVQKPSNSKPCLTTRSPLEFNYTWPCKMKSLWPLETSGRTYPATQRNLPEDFELSTANLYYLQKWFHRMTMG